MLEDRKGKKAHAKEGKEGYEVIIAQLPLGATLGPQADSSLGQASAILKVEQFPGRGLKDDHGRATGQ